MSTQLKLCEGVYLQQSDLWMINTGIILNDLGSILIDPAYFPEELQNISGFVKNKNCKVGYVVLTHSDFDHIVGGRYFNGARTVAHSSFANCNRRLQIQDLIETDLAYNVRREDFVFPEIDILFEDRFTMPIKNGSLHFYAAPGHTEDSVFTLYEGKAMLFAGDTLSDMEFPFIYYSSSQYRKSLDLARHLTDSYDIRMLIPGHGNVAVGREQIIERIDRDIDYIDKLVGATRDLYGQGLWEREIVAVLMDFNYAGEPIEGSMLKAHLDNVKHILRELKGE